MSSTTLIRWSGLATLLGGSYLILFLLIHPFGELDRPELMQSPQWVLAHSFHVVGATVTLLGTVGLYTRQAQEAGCLGLIGFVLAVVGMVFFARIGMITAFVQPALAAHTPHMTSTSRRLAKGPLYILPFVLMLMSWMGDPLFGLSIMWVGVLPRCAGALLILGALLFFVPPVVVPYVIPFVGALLFGGALIWLGYALWSGQAERTRQAEWAADRMPCA